MKKVLLKDIVIKAGTVFDDAPTETKRYGKHIQCLISLSDDTCGNFNYPLDDLDEDKMKEYFKDVK